MEEQKIILTAIGNVFKTSQKWYNEVTTEGEIKEHIIEQLWQELESKRYANYDDIEEIAASLTPAIKNLMSNHLSNNRHK